MSVALPPQRIGSEAFTLLTRLFAGLKRRGRVIDVIWFQQSADYARAVLALADDCDEDEVRKISAALRALLRDYVAPPQALPVTAPGDSVGAEPAVPPSLPADRYVGRLR